jgi:hypothetical protein
MQGFSISPLGVRCDIKKANLFKGGDAMRVVAVVIFLGIGLLAACSYVYKDPAPQLVEAEASQMETCRKLGVISDMADAGKLSEYDAAYRMVANIKTRAVRMGATHIVWLSRNKLSATAMAYQCPAQ